jgi:hypothetical protein
MVRKVLTGGPGQRISVAEMKKAPLVGKQRLVEGRFRAPGLLPVLLNAGSTQSGESMLVDGHLPAQEFFGSQRVALTGFFKAQQTTADGGNNFGLAADDPAAGAGGRQVGNRQGTAIGPYDILDPRAVGFGHDTLTQKFNDLE